MYIQVVKLFIHSIFMKTLAHRVSASPYYTKALEWGKLITITGSTQAIVQLTSFVSGILIIRLLSTQEYALYTLTNTMLGTMAVLSDSGIANGVMAESGKVWQDKEKMGVVLITGLNLRGKFGVISLIVTLPILVYLLVEHGAGWLTVVLIALSIIPVFFATLSDSLLEIILKVHQDINPLQRNQVEVSLGRLVFNGLFLFVFPYTFVALIAVGVPRIYGNYKLKQITAKFASQNQLPDPIIKNNIVKGIKRTLPIVIYYCLSGQLSIWLISFFGTTSNIAEIGALGRFSMIFNLFSVLFSTLVVPRFARMKEHKKSLLNTFVLIQACAFAIGILLLLLTWFFSTQILWVLGKNYLGLNHELLLICVSNSIGLMGGVCSQLILSRGWFLKPYFLIILNLCSTFLSFYFFDMTNLRGILHLNILITIVYLSLMLVYALFKLNAIEDTEGTRVMG
jgi:O-antigen/teichoic acid export membrane protein